MRAFSECPKCKSPDISYDDTIDDVEVINKLVECQKCGYRWYEVYEFISNRDYETDEELDPENIVLEPPV